MKPGVEAPTVVRHSALEDVLGIAIGAIVISSGLFLLKAGAAVTGGTAGLSLLISYIAPLPFGVVFVVVNLPFFLLAIRRKGWSFSLRSGVTIALVSALSTVHPLALSVAAIDTVYAAVLGNILCGLGILILFRHNSSVGGFSIVALVLQERAGLRAGYVQMALDAVVILLAFTAVSPINVLISGGGAVILNLILALNHRPGRYFGS